MKANEISGFLSARFCISVFLIAGLIGTGAAQSYDNLYSSSAPQTAQARAELFKAIQNMDEKSNPQTAQNGTDLYKALQNPYVFKDPQAALENANTYKALQKLNGIYSSSRVEDNWYYWTNMWLNGPQEATGTNVVNIYGTMSNPYALKDPQAALETANTYKELQKLNAIYSSSRVEDNWYYWTNMWLNEPYT
jgi:ssDNA-specific exonuclease RecJ